MGHEIPGGLDSMDDEQRFYLEDSSYSQKDRSVPFFDFHLHTNWTDGSNTVKEMYQQSVAVGLQAILYSEHGRKTSEDWFFTYVDEVRNLPSGPCVPFVGLESKIEDFGGSLDATEDMVSACDLVMGSVHRFPGEEGQIRGFGEIDPSEAVETEFHLSMAALENPALDILGHPFGMSYRRFGVEPDEEKVLTVIEQAAKNNKAIEINSRYHPAPWLWIRWCLEAGAMISLGSNAHELASVGQIIRILKGEEESWNRSES